MSIGERIMDLRRQRDISQGQLAQLMGVSRQAVSKWENDQTSPDTLKLVQLAQVLDTQVEYLATGNQSPQKEDAENERVEIQIEKVVERVEVEKVVERVVEKPVIKRVKRIQYRQDPLLLTLVGVGAFIAGLFIGLIF